MLATTTCLTGVLGSACFKHRSEVLENDDRLSARVGELKFQFARFVQGIDVHHCAAGAQDRGDSNRILQDIGHHDRDAGAAFQSTALQPCGKCARSFVELMEREGLAHAYAGLTVRTNAAKLSSNIATSEA